MKKQEHLVEPGKTEPTGMTRREALRLSGLALGGLAFGGAMIGPGLDDAEAADSCNSGDCECAKGPSCSWDDDAKANRYSYFDNLSPYSPFSDTPTTIPRLGYDEMRITFMGSSIPPNMRRVQAMMSVFVEVGWDDKKQMPLDQFVFDCGSGVCTNYAAMNVGFGRMNKVFLNHLHGDHMSDLTHIYCFGPSSDRLSPLYVWGPGRSGVESPAGSGKYYKDGTKDFCRHLREACRWHTESFSFQSTARSPSGVPDPVTLRYNWGLPADPIPVGDDPYDDGYAMVPIELDWTKRGEVQGDNVAYHNRKTGVKITHFPVIHARKGSIGYKLQWNGLTMIYTSDTKPENLCIQQAKNNDKGVDVFIHEMIVPAQVWATKIARSPTLLPFDNAVVQQATMVQNSSHTPQGAFGYLLSQINPRPRLTVATHFPVADDTVACAKKSIRKHCNIVQGRDPEPGEDVARITWSFDLMVITVSKDRIVEQRGEISDFGFSAKPQPGSGDPATPKYHDDQQKGDPLAQLDQTTAIEPCDCATGICRYREDGY